MNTWYKVQPHLGVTVFEDFYHRKWLIAQSNGDEMKEFRNKLLNVFTKNEIREWINPAKIEELTYKHTGLNGARCVVAVDLSVCDDFSSILAGFIHSFYLVFRKYVE